MKSLFGLFHPSVTEPEKPKDLGSFLSESWFCLVSEAWFCHHIGSFLYNPLDVWLKHSGAGSPIKHLMGCSLEPMLELFLSFPLRKYFYCCFCGNYPFLWTDQLYPSLGISTGFMAFILNHKPDLPPTQLIPTPPHMTLFLSYITIWSPWTLDTIPAPRPKFTPGSWFGSQLLVKLLSTIVSKDFE